MNRRVVAKSITHNGFTNGYFIIAKMYSFGKYVGYKTIQTNYDFPETI